LGAATSLRSAQAGIRKKRRMQESVAPHQRNMAEAVDPQKLRTRPMMEKVPRKRSIRDRKKTVAFFPGF
jgi:hypothetical protein